MTGNVETRRILRPVIETMAEKLMDEADEMFAKALEKFSSIPERVCEMPHGGTFSLDRRVFYPLGSLGVSRKAHKASRIKRYATWSEI